MILFLNFAPITFMGGAEKWMMDVSSFINKSEPTVLVSMSPSLSNWYGSLVLGRPFDKRASIKKESYSKKIDLGYIQMIPFSTSWKKTRESFKNARLIYAKGEILEIILLFYFGGFGVLKKTIAGLHSPFIYYRPSRSFDRVHNSIYTSVLTKYFLQKMYRVHVINTRDKQFLTRTFLLKNVSYIPNGVQCPPLLKTLDNAKEKLHVLFIGELSQRKGVDILLEVIRRSPDQFRFSMTSDGSMRNQVQLLAREKRNFTYYGYVSNEEKERLYQKADVLILPSRGEGFPLVILDAMRHGLLIVDSQNIRLDLPEYVEYTSKNNAPEEYLTLLHKIYASKQRTDFRLNKRQVFTYCVSHFSQEKIFRRLKEELFK
jgi:glycosyltransferase involved in cell wall biosynthesis